METTLIIIFAYILNVFLNRWLNKILYKCFDDVRILPWFWFLSLIGTCVLIVGLIVEALGKISKDSNWFTGKHW